MKDGGRLKAFLDFVYHRYHRRELVPPDPLQCLYSYDDATDREVVAVLAASLAVGRAQSIVQQVEAILSRMGVHPAYFLRHADAAALEEVSRGFRYRFFSEEDLGNFLKRLSSVLCEYGSLESAMAVCLKRSRGELLEALNLFAGLMASSGPHGRPTRNRLVAIPASGSACKRWHLFLRWMVRCDTVDPGGWSCLQPKSLMVPVDTHMFSVARICGLTQRRHSDWKTVLEITEGFRRLMPEDPCRYDFSLTRMAMRDRNILFSWWKPNEGGTECEDF